MRIPIDSSTSYRGRNSRPNWLVLLAFIGANLAAAGAGALLSPAGSPSAARWYAMLAKPGWAPPNSWFAPVWTVLYVLIGIAAWLIWQERYHRRRASALVAYAFQFLLNALWAPAFFGAKSIGAGLFLIVALWLSIIWAVREFAVVKPGAAWLLAPHLIWVTFAGAWNFAFWKLNQ